VPSKDKSPVSMRIRLKYPDVETFVEKYAANISHGGMFIQSRAPQPVGTLIRFDVLLQDGTSLLRGEGRVIWVKEYDAAHPTRVHGMGVRFASLDDASEEMVKRILAYKAEDSATAAPRRVTSTQEVRALVVVAETGQSEEPEPLEGLAERDIDATPVTHEPGLDSAKPFAALLDDDDEREDLDAEHPAPDDATRPFPLATVTASDAPDGTPYQPAGPNTPTRELRPGAGEVEPASEVETQPVPEHSASMVETQPYPKPSIEEPPRVSAEELSALAAALEAGGDGVSVALAMAEQVLTELLAGSGITDAQLAATVASITTNPPRAADDKLFEELALPPSLPPATVAEAMTSLARLQPASAALSAALPSAQVATPAIATVTPPVLEAPVAAPAVPAPAVEEVTAPATAAAIDQSQAPAQPSAEELSPGDEPPVDEPFDPTLLQAAARSARAAKRTHPRAFDLSEPTPDASTPDASSQRTADVTLPLVPPAGAELTTTEPAESEESTQIVSMSDGGWKKVQTKTEWLDHGSDHVLKDMAHYAGEHASAEAIRSHVDDHPTVGETTEVLPMAALEPEERATEPFIAAESEENLSREVWREVVHEAASELGDVAERKEPINPLTTADMDLLANRLDNIEQDFFDETGALPPPAPEEESSEILTSLEGDDLDTPIEAEAYADSVPQYTDPAEEYAEPPEELADEYAEPVDEYAEPDEYPEPTSQPAFAEPTPEPVRPQPRRRLVVPDVDLDAANGFGDEVESTVVTAAPHFEEPFPPLGASQPQVFTESEPFPHDPDQDPDLHDEVFEALAGLRDTFHETGKATAAPRPEPEPIPTLEHLADAPAPPAEEPPAVDEEPKLKPRKSGIFRRIFGKKE
jgi:uncharacterized protein (TIGR02266 family)